MFQLQMLAFCFIFLAGLFQVWIAYLLESSSTVIGCYLLINFGFYFHHHFFELVPLYYSRDFQYFCTLFLEMKVHRRKRSFEIHYFFINWFFKFVWIEIICQLLIFFSYGFYQNLGIYWEQSPDSDFHVLCTEEYHFIF